MSNYDFSLEDKNQKSKTMSKSKKFNLECIDGFVEDDTKHNLLDEHSSPQIPPGNLILSFLFLENKHFYFIRMASSRNV